MMVTISADVSGGAAGVTVGCAQQPHRTQSAGHLPSGTVSVTDVQVSGYTKASRPDASAKRIATIKQRRNRTNKLGIPRASASAYGGLRAQRCRAN